MKTSHLISDIQKTELEIDRAQKELEEASAKDEEIHPSLISRYEALLRHNSRLRDSLADRINKKP